VFGPFDVETWHDHLTRFRTYSARDLAYAALQLQPEGAARGIAAALSSPDAQVRLQGLAVLRAIVKCWTTLGYDKKRSPASQATPLIRALKVHAGEAILALPRDDRWASAFVDIAPVLAVSRDALYDRARDALALLAQRPTQQGDTAAFRLRFYFPTEPRDKPPTCPRPRPSARPRRPLKDGT
jgi:hypothetical protein